jgi:hypothetical protein
MKKIFSVLDSIIAFVLGTIIDIIANCIAMSIKLSYRFRKKSIPEPRKLIMDREGTEHLQHGLRNNFTAPKAAEDFGHEDGDRIYSHDFEEREEFEKIKGYLSKKAVELGGVINWHESADGLIIYLFEFPDTKTLRIFEEIMKDVTLNGLKDEPIDDDIEDMLSEIENKPD